MSEENQIIPQNIPDIPLPTVAQIRAVRNYFGWNQTEAAGRFDVGPNTLMDMERGARDPQTTTRHKIGLAMMRLGIRFDAGAVILPPDPPTV